MAAEKHLGRFLKGLIERMFNLDKMRFDKIVITQGVIDSIMEFAKESHPKEFLAFLDGRVKNKRLIIDKLMYQEFVSDNNSAMPIFHFPQTFYGSVHSHPGHSNRPSNADRQFFSKTGIINLIIKYPYTQKDIRFCNHNAEEISVEIEDEAI